jgi:hypothetical protein
MEVNVKSLPKIARFYLQPEEGGIYNYGEPLPVRDFHGCGCLMAPLMVKMHNKNSDLQHFCKNMYLIAALKYKVQISQENGRAFMDKDPLGNVYVDQVVEIRIQSGLNPDNLEEKKKRFALLDLFSATCSQCPYKVPEIQK